MCLPGRFDNGDQGIKKLKVADVIHMYPDNGVYTSVTGTKPKLAFSPLEKSPYEMEFTSSLRTFYTEMRTAIIRSKR